MHSNRGFNYLLLAPSCFLSVLQSSETAAAYVPVFGGPEYNSATSDGYQGAPLPSQPVLRNLVSNSGATVGTFQKRVAGTFQGRRVVAWSGSGAPAIEMQLPARFAGRPGGLAAYTRLFLLQLPQVPEPTAASLLLLAAGCSCGVRRSRPNYMR